METWTGKRVLITGVCGTVGQELLRQVLTLGPDEVIGIDNNESELFFACERVRAHPNVRLYVGDLRDPSTLLRKMDGVDVVLHTAALKHVILCERSPRDAIQTNILGTQNVIDAALANGVERVLFTSSDKAVNPTSVMGTSKLMGERLMTAANALRRGDGPIFASTRFGNVLGSRGSVIPIFERQIAAGGPVTLTDARMTRFIMTLEEAVRLVMESVFLARGGEVFVTKMPVVRISDLARVMVQELAARHGYDPEDVETVVVGSKPGEKLYEELMNDEETRRTIELTRYFVVKPAFQSVYRESNDQYPERLAQTVEQPYNSALVDAMAPEDVRFYLYTHGLLGGLAPVWSADPRAETEPARGDVPLPATVYLGA
ncbi:MAG: NAD-dependent epimerase/dehydratase family protein [Gemmatimonas sp.]|nr:NAD-dependent epimerase/dehydratase family protein [Gemmatimonas sp.]